MMGSLTDVGYQFVDTPLGTMVIRADAAGIFEIQFIDDAVLVLPEPNAITQRAVEQLTAYFKGTFTQFDLPISPVGTDFQKRVWTELRNIGHGTTISYSALAIKLGNVKTTRAVGLANGANPIAVVVPCHRVIGATGQLTGYAGGLWRKQWLLNHESRQTELFR